MPTLASNPRTYYFPHQQQQQLRNAHEKGELQKKLSILSGNSQVKKIQKKTHQDPAWNSLAPHCR